MLCAQLGAFSILMSLTVGIRLASPVASFSSAPRLHSWLGRTSLLCSPVCLPPGPLQQELPIDQPSLHSLKTGSSDLVLLMQGGSPEISRAPHFLQFCQELPLAPGCRGAGSGREKGEGLSHANGASCLPWLPPLLSGLASLESRQVGHLCCWLCLVLELCKCSLPAQMD